MAGAILSHLTKLGIEVQGDGGTLFAMACLVLLASLVLVATHRRQLPFLGARTAAPAAGSAS